MTCKSVLKDGNGNKRDLSLFCVILGSRPATIFLSKSLRFLKCEKRARGCQFSEKPDSARVSHNFQRFSDLGHKKHVKWMDQSLQ